MADNADRAGGMERFSTSALVLAAHGSPSSEGKDLPTSRLARRLAKSGVFSSVSHGFLEQSPKISDVLGGVGEGDVYLVPVMTCRGYISGTKLPRAIGLTGNISERIGPNGRQKIHLCDPVGVDPGLPAVATSLITNAIKRSGINPDEASVLVAGHGSMQSRASLEQTNAIAKAINSANSCPAVKTVFLEEPPRISDWDKVAEKKNVFVLPVMISDGHHGRVDIARDMGIEPDSAFNTALDERGLSGPHAVGGRNVYVIRPLGEMLDEMAGLVLSTVLATVQATALADGGKS